MIEERDYVVVVERMRLSPVWRAEAWRVVHGKVSSLIWSETAATESEVREKLRGVMQNIGPLVEELRLA
jgi:hypothetical protein